MSHASVATLLNQPAQTVLDTAGCICTASSHLAPFLGHTTEDLPGKNLRDCLIALQPEWNDLLPDPLATTSEPLFLPWTDDDHPAPIGLRIEILPHDQLLLVNLTPTIAPSTDLALAEVSILPPGTKPSEPLLLRLRQAESRLQHYVEHFPGIFYSQRPDFSFSYLAPGFEELFGICPLPYERRGSVFHNLILESDRENIAHEIERLTPQGKTFELVYRVQHPCAGNILYLLDVRTPRFAPSGLLLGYEGVWLDITRRMIAEKRLSRTAWKENLATLTNGLIHDFSNIMAGIYSLSELYLAGIDETHPHHRGLQQIMENSRQARHLVRRIIDLNREIEGTPTYHNLEQLLREQLELIRVILPRQTRIETNFTGEELPVYIDDVSFRQMILNFAMNTRDALPRDGLIELKVSIVHAGDSLFADHSQGAWTAPRPGALIAFRDNGSGIAPEHLPRIFDPFFTTKDSLKGSGFGLYNARLFTREAGGNLDATSHPGQGTTLSVYLPLADFTENLPIPEDSPDETEAVRHRIAIYANQDISQFALVERLTEEQWELITFHEPASFLDFLAHTSPRPGILLFVMMISDESLLPLVEEIARSYPRMRRALLTFGCDEDEISSTIHAHFDLILHEDDRARAHASQLARLLENIDG